MRRLAALLLLALPAPAADAPGEWLVVDEVDDRGRAPFNPDRVFARYLLRRDAPPPREGERVGDRVWRRSASIEGDYAYAAVRRERDEIVLARLLGGATLFVNGDAFAGDVYGSGTAPPAVPLRKGENHLFVRGIRGTATLAFEPVAEGLHRASEDSGFGARVVVNASATPADGLVPFGVRKLPTGEPPPAGCRAFVSRIDGSVQWYAYREPTGPRDRARIVLALHGASVSALAHAAAYSQKPDFWIVAPNNRRPFGFDWQDWGRVDAYEAWEDALAFTGAPRAPTYLTGHSMGGHGTWHLAANDPDAFAAIAPSAGWISFATYGNARPTRFPDLPSQTLELLPNLAEVPAFVVHGLEDDNVPPAEATRMLDALAELGAAPGKHLEGGGGHWWDGDAAEGADCVDLPAIFQHFRGSTRAPWRRWIGAGLDARHFEVEVAQPLDYARVTVVERVEGGYRTQNVRRMRVHAGAKVRVDGQEAPGGVWLLRRGTRWEAREPVASEKSPDRSGPFRRAFDNRFVMVYGDAESLARARYDAQVWYYRANGDAPVLTDAEFLAGGYSGRNVVLYGNADTNRAFAACLDASCPIRVREGAVAVGERAHAGDDLAVLFVYPRKGEPRALVGVFGHTGPAGARLGYALLPFTSGVGYPDYALFDPGILESGEAALREAGWFDHDWSLP